MRTRLLREKPLRILFCLQQSNHNEDVNRLATRCTAGRVSVAIKGELLGVFTPEKRPSGSMTAADARIRLRAKGICAFVSYRGEENGRHIYSIGNLSPYGGFDLPLLYKKLNQVEDLTGNDVWGGSDNCGGSPRERGSSLCPRDLSKLIDGFQSA